MNTVLWVIQIVLCLKFLTVVFSHGIRPDPEKMKRGAQKWGSFTHALLGFVAALSLLASLGLALPYFVRSLVWLVPWAAALLALMNLAAIGFHLSCRETPRVWVSLILFALAAFTAYGRWVLALL
jgi:hypothetical protein